jgi:hypothetical protein
MRNAAPWQLLICHPRGRLNSDSSPNVRGEAQPMHSFINDKS